MAKKILLAFAALLTFGICWFFYGSDAYDRFMNPGRIAKFNADSVECTIPWENLRFLQPRARPGSRPEDDAWYTPVYYEQVAGGERRQAIALYAGKQPPDVSTCEKKFSGRYGNVDYLSPGNYPVALTIYEGSFVIRKTDDPARAVPLEKLPLVAGPLAPILRDGK